MMALAEWRSGSRSDSTRTFGHAKIDFFGIGGGVVRRFTLLPGWRWSKDMGPVAKTEWCEATHFQYQTSGRLHVLLHDGTEFELAPGDLAVIPSGHDTWVVGSEPVVLVDWYRASSLAGEGRREPVTSDDMLPRSERWFQALLTNTIDLVALVSAEGEILFTTPSAEQVVGWAPAELKGRKLFELVHPEDLDRLKAALARAVEQHPGQARFEELRFRTREGAVRRLEVIGNNRLADPAVRGIVVSARDVTEKREAQEQLRASEERLHDLVLHMPVLMGAASADMVPLAWNKECERVIGWSAAEVVRNPRALEFLVPEAADRETLRRRLRDVGPDFRNLETSVTCRDGTLRTIAWSSLAGQHPIRGWTLWAVGRDVTAEKHATHALIEASRLAATSALAAGMAGNISALMTRVEGNASLLLASTQDLDARESLSEIAKAAREAGRLLQQVLSYARGGGVKPQPTNLNEFVTEAVDAERDAVLRREITVDLDAKLERIEADPGEIRQLVDNLLTNAAQAITGPGRITVQTRNVRLPEEDPDAPGDLPPGPYVRLRVRDTGCGMDTKTMARAFEPFFSTKFAARGLGLPAVSGIVKSQRGAVSIASRPGDGSTFTVHLPAMPAG